MTERARPVVDVIKGGKEKESSANRILYTDINISRNYSMWHWTRFANCGTYVVRATWHLLHVPERLTRFRRPFTCFACAAPPRRFVVRAATAPRRGRVIYKLYIQSCNQTRAFSSCSTVWARGQPPPYLPRSRYYTSRRTSKDTSWSEDRAGRKSIQIMSLTQLVTQRQVWSLESYCLEQFLIQRLQSSIYKICFKFR